LQTIAGRVPELIDLPAGCAFAERCGWVIDACRSALPPLLHVGHGHDARCIRVHEILGDGR
jgi:peptide/nickel transport system ATP-binding protein